MISLEKGMVCSFPDTSKRDNCQIQQLCYLVRLILELQQILIQYLYHSLMIPSSVIGLDILFTVFSVVKSFVPRCRIICYGFISRRVAFTQSRMELTFAPENVLPFTKPLCLIFFCQKITLKLFDHALSEYINRFFYLFSVICVSLIIGLLLFFSFLCAWFVYFLD